MKKKKSQGNKVSYYPEGFSSRNGKSDGYGEIMHNGRNST